MGTVLFLNDISDIEHESILIEQSISKHIYRRGNFAIVTVSQPNEIYLNSTTIQLQAGKKYLFCVSRLIFCSSILKYPEYIQYRILDLEPAFVLSKITNLNQYIDDKLYVYSCGTIEQYGHPVIEQPPRASSEFYEMDMTRVTSLIMSNDVEIIQRDDEMQQYLVGWDRDFVRLTNPPKICITALTENVEQFEMWLETKYPNAILSSWQYTNRKIANDPEKIKQEQSRLDQEFIRNIQKLIDANMIHRQ
jgi:hypothetical protein